MEQKARFSTTDGVYKVDVEILDAQIAGGWYVDVLVHPDAEVPGFTVGLLVHLGPFDTGEEAMDYGKAVADDFFTLQGYGDDDVEQEW